MISSHGFIRDRRYWIIIVTDWTYAGAIFFFISIFADTWVRAICVAAAGAFSTRVDSTLISVYITTSTQRTLNSFHFWHSQSMQHSTFACITLAKSDYHDECRKSSKRRLLMVAPSTTLSITHRSSSGVFEMAGQLLSVKYTWQNAVRLMDRSVHAWVVKRGK